VGYNFSRREWEDFYEGGFDGMTKTEIRARNNDDRPNTLGPIGINVVMNHVQVA